MKYGWMRESLFTRKRRKPWAFRSALKPLLVIAVILLVLSIAKGRVAFYSDLYEGRRAIDKKQYAQAREAFQRAWKLKPEHRLVYDCAGFLFLSEQGPNWKASAQENYSKARARGLRSNFLVNHVKEARKFLDGGKYDQAAVEIDHALQVSPRNGTANMLSGHLYYAQIRLNKAIEQYQKALTYSPRSVEIQNALARAQESKSRGNVSYLLDRNGQVLAAQDAVTGLSTYPCDFWTANITGYRSENRGAGGLEEVFANRLRGDTITLTIDTRLQRIADSALSWQKGAVVIIKPSTGEILAAVSHPSYRPNRVDKDWWKIKNNPNNPFRNRPFEALYEPGSIGKIVTAAAIIETKVNLKKVFPFNCRGYLMIGNETFWDWTKHKTVSSFGEAFNQSCNIAQARMALHLGPSNLTQSLRSFGFGEQDQIKLELPVAKSRAPHELDKYYALASAACGLGSGYRITPLHAAMIAGAIGNGGVMMAPILVKDVRSVTGETIMSSKPRIFKISMKKETAAQVTQHMMEFVKTGIGRKAYMSRYNVAGKTGTSGSRERGLHGWFVCFAPAEKPEIAMAIVCENGGTGHGIAAPIARRILTEALR